MWAQKPTTCIVTAVPAIVHSEGITERLGDINLQCTGTPGVVVTANLSVMLPVSITNRVNSTGYSTDAALLINTGTGPVPSGVSGLVTGRSISFYGFQFTFPQSGALSLIVDDLRANVNELGLVQQTPLVAYLGGTILLANNPVPVAVALQGLLATSMDTGVTCIGSPTPSTVSVTNLLGAGTAEQTTRVTEGFPASFQPKDSTTDTGTRFLLNYANFPAGAAIYVPDAVAGTGAAVPSSGGDLGTPAAVGQYAPGSHTLLLVRVLNADNTGTGGTLATLPPPNGSGRLVLDGANSVPLTNGAGYVVYEVVDANQSATESAQIPNFFAIGPHSAPAAATGSLSLAPVSTVTSASTTAPIPRFAAVTPPSDCAVVGDCNASYFPQLQVTATANPMQVTAVAGGKRIGAGNLTIKNAKSGELDWSISVTYANGTGWVLLTNSVGIDNAEVQVVVDPSALAPGTYAATLTVQAGVAGSQTIPLSVTVSAAPATPSVVISSVSDAADFHPGPVAPGEFASAFGTNLGGQNVTAAFNGVPANLLYTGATQINLRVPSSLAGQTSAQLVVTVDGASSAPFVVPLTAVAPAIFTPGVLNQDYSVNSPSHPAALGSILQIFGTGMPDSGGVVTVTIQNRGNLVPLYAGAAPGLPGMQQINVAVPADLQPVTSNLIICVAGTGAQQYCSQPESIALHE
ncbi:MAG TPA: hypothetical protein VKR61_19475 [Bryobacteraceae bacterium]|nr:hypothetical protein [Bryobacteraceae bacterium]